MKALIPGMYYVMGKYLQSYKLDLNEVHMLFLGYFLINQLNNQLHKSIYLLDSNYQMISNLIMKGIKLNQRNYHINFKR